MLTINLKKDRKNLVNLFYHYLLMNNDVDYMKQDILDQTQMVFLDSTIESVALDIATKSPEILGEIESKLKNNWTMDRIPALIKAMLLEGAWEIQYTDNEKAIIINDLVEYCKAVEPDFDFKFVNAILDQFIKF